MKLVAAEKFHKTGLALDNRRQTVLTFGLPFQEPETLGHQNKKHRIPRAEQGGEGEVRKVALRPVIERRARIGQFVKGADEDQIRVPPQITPRNQAVRDADDQHERAQQCEITAEGRQFFANAQRGKSAGGEKGERDAEKNVVNRGDGEQASIIFFPGWIHLISLWNKESLIK